ncbi:cytochrome c oxidase subunit IV [Winogradskyella epiphytica]|uniref:Cytochrome c oxidase subunit IV n=1 Tax=Winogradskyella epiphytica TaxID=262005 RepID=A0A2V4X159_9FLAO|nr:cytochrome C oxidase subunit IV family protein [Winogradskyella epiphytica]PYE83632.1 cytochrome c oxidase subunit IV [Winogradskyella epiphytica]GGW59576.1 cytochrome c oxidase subunit IV [Winogradskyella epiphytica]
MAQEHKLAIFRGRWKFKSNTHKIWGVLALLSFVTAIEVILGIYKPDILMHTWMDPVQGSGFFATVANIILSPIVYMKPLNFIFILLTIVKAYYITWDFMHVRDEVGSLRKMIVWTGVFLICYLVFIILQEGGYVFEAYHGDDSIITHDF